MSGVIESLNVSVAAGVMLYEAVRQRSWQTATLRDRTFSAERPGWSPERPPTAERLNGHSVNEVNGLSVNEMNGPSANKVSDPSVNEVNGLNNETIQQNKYA
jgi:hypothetical protein